MSHATNRPNPLAPNRKMFQTIKRLSARLVAALHKHLNDSVGYCEIYIATLASWEGYSQAALPEEMVGWVSTTDDTVSCTVSVRFNRFLHCCISTLTQNPLPILSNRWEVGSRTRQNRRRSQTTSCITRRKTFCPLRTFHTDGGL